MDNFVKALNQASNDFRQQALINGFTNLEIDEIILKVKQHIGRFEIIKTNIDHFFEEYWRGAFSSTVTNRARTIQTNDRNAATILPAVANSIKSFEKHSVLPNQAREKLKGIVTYSLLLYNYGIRNDLFRVMLQLDLQPYKYGDKNTRKKIEKIAKLLGIQAFQIDLTNQEIIEGCKLLCYGAFAEGINLFGENIEQFNLPKELEVSLIDHTIRFSNVERLISSAKSEIFENDVLLRKALEKLFLDSISLERIYQAIHSINEQNFNNCHNIPYPYKNAALFIKEKRLAFLKVLLDIPKSDWDAKNPNIFRNLVQRQPNVLASVSELTQYYNDCKIAFEAWVDNLKRPVCRNEQTFEKSIMYLEEAAENYSGDTSFDTIVHTIALDIYEQTSFYNLTRTKSSNLVGAQI